MENNRITKTATTLFKKLFIVIFDNRHVSKQKSICILYFYLVDGNLEE